MATGTYAPWYLEQLLDDNGKPLSGGTIETFVAGTSTHAAVFSDVNLTTAYSNPLTLNSAGRLPSNGSMFLTPGVSYKFLIKNSAGTTIATPDNISSVPGSSAGVDVPGTAGETIPAGQAVYLSDGSGGKTAGLWYRADAANIYSSTSPEVGIAPNAISSLAAGTIRISGAVAGLTSLTIGAIYYVGTAGAITATAPSNKRIIGQADTTSSLVVGPISPVAVVDNTICDVRLSLTTGVPVTTADVTAAANVFIIPFRGNRIALYDGAAWNIRTFTQLTQALGTLSSGKPYDVFAYDNAGVVATEILAWTNDTTRATLLANQDGVLSKTGALTRRYLGTFYTTSTTTTEDSFAKRNLWNYYNRMLRVMRAKDTTDSWAYNGVFRQANAAAGNQLEFVIGVAENPVEAYIVANVSGNASATTMYVAIGEDSTTTPDVNCLVSGMATFNTGTPTTVQAQLKKYPAEGHHVWPWLEKGGAATTTWYGDNGGDGAQSGIHGVGLG